MLWVERSGGRTAAASRRNVPRRRGTQTVHTADETEGGTVVERAMADGQARRAGDAIWGRVV